ncbi:U3 small nucleolar RNA-associated protein 21 like [Verticillium longisporum]|nr:U3 small nucleolar RNA-associated protein 21 like [Verticillium longisporum]
MSESVKDDLVVRGRSGWNVEVEEDMPTVPEAKDERVWEREAERLERSRGRCTGVVATGVGVGVVEVDEVDGAPTDEAKVAEEAEVNTDDDAVRELERVESVRGGDAGVDVDVVWDWDRLEELFTARPVQGACWSIFLSLRVDGHGAKTQNSSNSDKADRLDGPLSKRQKLNVAAKDVATSEQASRIFAPFRTVGLVSPTNVPFTSIPLGKTTYQVTTSVGRALQTYDLKRGLNLVFVTRPQTPADITATCAWKEKVFAAWGDRSRGEDQGLWAFHRGRRSEELELPADLDEPIKQILIFGSWMVGCATTRLEIWKTSTLEHYTTLHTLATKKGDNEITGGVTNMPTYLNKIFVGRKDGWVEIWNVSTGKLIYTILPPSPDCGSVTCLQPSPALSLLAIAYSKGPLVVHNILTDKSIIQVNAGNEYEPVNAISFRTDGMGAGHDGRKDGVMATATAATGDVTFWDLNHGGRVMGVLRSAHNPPVEEGAKRNG